MGRPAPWRSLGALVDQIDEPARSACRALLDVRRETIESAAGATHNHQTWIGGYVDHVAEAMNIAVGLYDMLAERRTLEFSLSDILIVLFVHDLEKPWRQDPVVRQRDFPDLTDEALESPAGRMRFRKMLASRHGLRLTSEQCNAVRYVEGENDAYSPTERRMSGLAAVCHCCDTLSARLWPERPYAQEEMWGWRQRD